MGARASAAEEQAREDLADAAADRQVERPRQVVLKQAKIYNETRISAHRSDKKILCT